MGCLGVGSRWRGGWRWKRRCERWLLSWVSQRKCVVMGEDEDEDIAGLMRLLAWEGRVVERRPLFAARMCRIIDYRLAIDTRGTA